MEPPKTLLLTETGLALLPDGSTAVNVGPIVRALKFLTEGRGDDRGLDEAGNPLPDLMSLAFEVVESIIVGGRKAEAFRRVKSELDAQAGGTGRSSLALAKRASRVQPAAAAAADAAATAALEQASRTLQALLAGLQGATEQLLSAMSALRVAPKAKRKKKAKAPRRRAVPKGKRKAPLKKAGGGAPALRDTAKRKRKSR